MMKNQSQPSPWLTEYADRARRHHVDPARTSWNFSNSAYFSLIKQSMRQLETFANRLFSISSANTSVPDSAAWALINKEGYLVNTWGNTDMLLKDDIRPGMHWSFMELGANAVTIGLEDKSACTSIGEENYNDVLKKYAIYFSCIRFNEQNPTFDITDYGGIALIVPVENQNEHYRSMLGIITHDVVLNLHTTMIVTTLHSRNKYGMLFINTVNPANPIVVQYNPQFAQMAGVPPVDHIYFPLSDLIERIPENQRLYQIVEEQQWVKDLELSVFIHGVRKDFILTSEPYKQHVVGGVGTILRFDTHEAIAAEISKKVSNNARLSFDDIVGESPCMQQAISMAKAISLVDSNVMLVGESGVGKDVFAQAIHNNSSRRNKPFVVVNCGALPRELIASELFGYAPGCFTGAKKQGNIGKFELANGGTIFLDEIGELPLELQATLLRIVEQKQFMRLGDNRLVSVDVKIICATNADIPALIAAKQFRADLYYRLATMQLRIPPLRDRGSDIILLANHFINRAIIDMARTTPFKLTDSAEALFMTLPYEGNVRELQSLVSRMVLFCQKSSVSVEDIMPFLPQSSPVYQPASETVSVSPGASLIRSRKAFDREELLEALAHCDYNKELTAQYLGVSRATLYRQMKKLGF